MQRLRAGNKFKEMNLQQSRVSVYRVETLMLASTMDKSTIEPFGEKKRGNHLMLIQRPSSF